MEWCTGETLESLIDTLNGLKEDVIRSYVKEILEGLKYIHSKNIFHGYAFETVI